MCEHMPYAQDPRKPKEDALRVELKMTVRILMQVIGTRLGAPGRAGIHLCH